MCLAIVLKKGTNKYEDLIYKAIENSSVTNNDGMGYAFKRASTKKVYISKGYRSIDAIWTQLEKHKLKDEDELIIHLRNGNKGAINTDMCHPFVCNTEKDIVLLNDQYVHDMVMVHNGTFSSYSEYNSAYSDTYNIASELFSLPEIQQLMKRDLALFESSFRRILSTNKLAFLFPDEATPLITIGKFIEKNGFLFSNESYKDKTVVDYGGYRGGSTMSRFRNQAYYDGFGWDDEFEEDYDDITDLTTSTAFERNLTVVGDDEEDDLPFTLGDGLIKAGLLPNHSYSGCVSTDIQFPTSVAPKDEFISNGIRYRKLGNAYIPEQYTGVQFQAIRVKLNEFNANDLEFVSQIKDTSRGIEEFCYYTVESYEMESDDTSAPSLHTLKRKYPRLDGSQDDPYIFVTSEFLLKNFRVSYKSDAHRKYIDYFYLLSKIVLTKTTLVQIQKFLNTDTHNINDTVKFRGELVKKSAIYIFYYDLLKELFPQDYLKKLTLLTH